MSARCNACYLATTQPEWIARIVTNMREDKPCEMHREERSDDY